MALATLVLGGTGCGSDSDSGSSGSGSESGSGVDVGASRIRTVVKAVCNRASDCYDDDDEEFDEDACVDEGVDYLTALLAKDQVCADAYLDYYACYATLSCEEGEDDDNKCAALGAKLDAACEGVVDDDDSGLETD